MLLLKRWGLLAVLVAVLPSSAGAVAVMKPDGAPANAKWQRWANPARVPAPPGQVTLRLEPCPDGGYRACASMDTIYFSPDLTRSDFRHEEGHVFDYRNLTDADHAVWVVLLGASGPWFDPSQPHDERASERFAWVYAGCAEGWFRGAATDEWQLPFFGTWRPMTRQLWAMCGLIRHTGGWYMRPDY